MSLDEAKAKIAELEAENRALRERLARLERRLGLDSQNSSKPPSSDGFKKAPRRTQSLRSKSNRASGGQVGHEGQTLESVDEPEHIQVHPVREHCSGCGLSLEQVALSGVLRRQVFDLPPLHIEVTEHRAERKHCPRCGQYHQGQFPVGVNAPVQYGPRIRALGVYLNQQHFIPEQRLSEVFSDVFGASIRPATVTSAISVAADACEPLVERIRERLEDAVSKHLDETGFRINATRQWLHVVSTADLSWYRTSPKRKDLEPLSGLTGVVIHDHWKSYYQLANVSHGLCNAHHLRELKALDELDHESWAKSMTKLLRVVCGYRHRYPEGIPSSMAQRIRRVYEGIVGRGLSYHHSLPPLPRNAKKGPPKRRVGHNLLRRLDHYANDVLRCLFQVEVSFTNNQAERDLRMMKLKQKISGGFRSSEGAKRFVTIRSVLSTARKQSCNVMELLTTAVQGKTPALDL